MDWKPRIRELLDSSEHVIDEDIIEELAAHAGSVYEARRADGLDVKEAEAHVLALIDSWREQTPRLRRRLQRPSAVKPPAMEVRPFAGLIGDIRYAFRLLRHQRGFAGLSILTMALAIGITTALFSVTYGVLLKPLPWPEPDRLIRLAENRQGASRPHPLQISNGAYLAWQEQPATIAALGGFWTSSATMTAAGQGANRTTIGHVTASVFEVIRARPLLGALFAAEDETTLATVILSYGVWQERFAGSPAALGKSIQLDGKSYTIIGVMPRDFEFPDRGARAWVPYQVRPVISSDGRGTSSQIFSAIARLRSGATPAQAAAEATARARSAPSGGLADLAFWGTSSAAQISAAPALTALTQEVRPGLVTMFVAVILLLLTALANVASLQLTRAATRRREIAIRSAIGAVPRRIIRQFLMESLLLGLAGGAAGLVLAAGLHRALPSLMPSDFPRLQGVSFDWPVAMFALGLTLVTGIVVGILPAILAGRAGRVNLIESLTDDGKGSIGGKRYGPRGRLMIMIGQVAIACTLLIGAVLLGRSFLAMMHADRGYDPSNVLTARIPMPDGAFTAERRTQMLDEIAQRLRILPQVTRVGYTDGLPLTASETLSAFTMPSNRAPVGATIQAHAVRHVVSQEYLSALGMRVVAGRLFNRDDTAGSMKVVVVNRSFARQSLSDTPLGDKIVNFAGSNASGEYEVVGIIEDVLDRALNEPAQPQIYSLRQQTVFRSTSPGIVLRTTGDPRTLIDSLKSAVREQDSSLALDSIMTMEDRLAASLEKPRFYALLLSAFSISALLIAAVGLFGVLSYSVSQRTREFALRTALGATPADVIRLVLNQGLLITIGGIGIGTGLSLAFTRYLGSLLYGVGSADWSSIAVVCAIIVGIAAVACIVPAVRAIRITPLRALRW